MKDLRLLFLFLLCSVTAVAQENCSKDELEKGLCLFGKPLIIGASLSKGLGANEGGPSALIASSLNPAGKIKVDAISGAKTEVTLADLKLPKKKPSVVMGLDLFYWDVVKKDCGEEWEARARAFFKLYQEADIPMIIGKVPDNIRFPVGWYLPQRSSVCLKKINEFIKQECTIEKNCLIYDVHSCFEKTYDVADAKSISERDDYLAGELSKYYWDKFHLTLKGNEFCAQQFVSQGTWKQLHCPKE